MRRVELTRELELATRPLAAPSDAFRASLIAAARATTGLHELYVLQYAARTLSPPRGVLFAILAAPGADVGATAREFHAQVALRFDKTDSFHYTVGNTANAALIPHCVEGALWHRTRFTERPPPRPSGPLPGPRSVAPLAPSAPAPPRLPTFTPSTESRGREATEGSEPPPDRPSTFADLVDRYALDAWDKQDWHLEVHEGCSAALDLSAGELVLSTKGLFAKKRRYRTQLVGAEQGRTWRWSWGDGDRSIPESVRASSHTVRRRGEREQVRELMTATLPLEGLVQGELLASVASGLLDASFYFRVPTDEGGLYVVVSDPAFPKHGQEPTARALATLPRAFASVTIPNHYAAVRAYFRALGLRADEHVQAIVARSRSGHAIRAEFDAEGRLAVVESI